VSFITGTSVELLYANPASFTAKATFTTEANINDVSGTLGGRPKIPADFWLPGPSSNLKGLRIVARGILSTTAGPTFTFTIRMGTNGNITTAPIIFGSGAITMGTTITNANWEFEGDVFLIPPVADAGGNSTMRGLGRITGGAVTGTGLWCNAGASATTPTVATVDTSIVNYINFNAACGTSSASNSIQLLQLLVFGLN
jgi:hypothetical protein